MFLIDPTRVVAFDRSELTPYGPRPVMHVAPQRAAELERASMSRPAPNPYARPAAKLSPQP